MRHVIASAAVLLTSVVFACNSTPEFDHEDGESGDKGLGGNGAGSGHGKSDLNVDDVLMGGANSGAGNGSGNGNGNVCEKISLDTDVIPPRVLILQDLSSSMIPQWEPLNDAMVGGDGVVTAYGRQMALGYMPFPSTYPDNLDLITGMTDDEFGARGSDGYNDGWFRDNDSDCTISAESIIAPGAGNTAAVTQEYENVNAARMVGNTPTNAAMSRAMEVLVDQAPDDGSAGYAILLTDGDPNCEQNPHAKVEAKIKALADAGVETYVIGYNYDGDALTNWAAAGTILQDAGDAPRDYIDADDQETLNTEMSSILSSLVPCDYELSSEVSDPEFVRVTIDDIDRPLEDGPEGWTLGDDKKTILLGQQVCDALQTAGDHTIDVTVECERVIVVPR